MSSRSYVAGLVDLIAVGYPTVASSVSPPPLPPTAVFPYVTVHQIFGEELQSMDGLSGMTSTMMQVNCWDKDYERAFSLRASLTTLIMAGVNTVTLGLNLKAVSIPRYQELYDGPRELHQLIGRYAIWWEA